VLLAAEEGIRHRSLQTELVWRTLQRGESAIVVSFVDAPVTVFEHFFAFGWNVLPYLESGHLQVVDCFTRLLREKHQTVDHEVAWNEYLRDAFTEAVTVVREPGDLGVVEDCLHERLADLELLGTGLVVVDSLNEIERQGRGFETGQFIKEVRGDVCARRYVPLFASTTSSGEDDGFAREHAYLFDGIVRMRRNDSRLADAWLKELGVRKMDGVPYRPHWTAYESLGRRGFQPFAPETEFASVYGYRPRQAPDGSRASTAESRPQTRSNPQ